MTLKDLAHNFAEAPSMWNSLAMLWKMYRSTVQYHLCDSIFDQTIGPIHTERERHATSDIVYRLLLD